MEIVIHDNTAESAHFASYAVRAAYATHAATALYATDAGSAAEVDHADVAPHSEHSAEAIWSLCCDDFTPVYETIKRNGRYRGWYGSGTLMPVNRIRIPIENGVNSDYTYTDALAYSYGGQTGENYFTGCSVVSDIIVAPTQNEIIPWERVNTVVMTNNNTSPYWCAATGMDVTHMYGDDNEWPGYEAYRCFDHHSGSYWKNKSTLVSHLIGLDFGSPKIIDAMVIATRGSFAGAYVDVSPAIRDHDQGRFFGTGMGIEFEEQEHSFGVRWTQSEWLAPPFKTFTFTRPVTAQSLSLNMTFSQTQITNTFSIREIKFYRRKIINDDMQLIDHLWKYTFNPAPGSSFAYPSATSSVNILKSQNFYLYSWGRLQINAGTRLYYYDGGLSNGASLLVTSTPRYTYGDFYWQSADMGIQVPDSEVPDPIMGARPITSRGYEEVKIDNNFEEYISRSEDNLYYSKAISSELMEKQSGQYNKIQSSAIYNKINTKCRIYANSFDKNCIWLINGIEYKCKQNYFDITSKSTNKFKIDILDLKGEKFFKGIEIYFL